MFMAIVFLLLWIVIAIFGLIIAIVFEIFPQSVIPVFAQIPIAIWLGYQFYHKKSNYLLTAVVALVLLYIMVIIGAEYPIRLQPFWGISPVIQWTIVLMVYVYIASTLPVQVLLQPRDFINAYQLILTMVLMALGIIFSNPEMVAPAVNLHPEGAPNLMPMLFVIIACGAISGFHSVVSSGTSSKQCDREPNALFVGYGSMLTEGMLAVFVLIACGAGIGLGLKQGNTTLFGVDAFNQYYASWQAVEGLGSKINALVTGSSNMISKLGIPGKIVITLMGVFISTFAATTLDTATRLQRYIVAESAANLGNKFFQKKHPATAFAVISAMLLAFSNGSGNGAMRLWPLFGSLNQLLAGLALLVITVYLKRKNVNMFYSLLPMIFMILMTGWAMGINLVGFYNLSDWLLFSIGLIVVFFEVWILIESAILLFHRKDISDNR
jgi:carbon starvation protein